MTTQPQPEELPPLPEPYCYRTIDFGHGLGAFYRTLSDVRKHLDSLGKFGGTTFTTEGNSWPMFTANQTRAYATEHAAKLHAECEALRADAERWRFARDNIVAFYETTGHWRLYMLDGTIVYEGTASSYQGAIDAARAAKEQA